MHTLSLTRPSTYAPPRQTLGALLVCFSVLLLVANALLVGFAISARADTMRATLDSATLRARIVELESSANMVQAPSPVAARALGFVTPVSFSYATVRPLGVLPLRGVGDASFNGL